MPKPTTRVLAVLELLQSQGLVSGAELARRVEVDARTLRRYITALEDMGIPITTEQGRYGGYRLVPGYKLPPMMFSEEEAQALSLGLIAARGLGLADAAPAIESVQAKLDRVLPSAPRRTVSALRESVALQVGGAIPGGARTPADARLLRILSESAQSRRTAALRYRSADGSLTSRDFDVYGNVFRAGRWYVVGHCHLRQGLRTLRLDRVAHAELRDARFARPEGFDAGEYLTRALASVPRGPATEIFLHTDLECARRELFNGLGIAEAVEGGVLVRGYAEELEWYARELMRLPFRFEIRGPPALREVLRRLAQDLLKRTSEPADAAG